jgi:signal peptidase I
MARIWREWIRSIVLIVLVVTSFRSAVADWNDVPSGSMKPSILIGDRIFVNKLAYDLKVPYTTWRLATWGSPQRGEIAVLYSPADGKRLVKRVIALAGDTIAMRSSRLILNGEPVEYEPLDLRLPEALPPNSEGRLLAAEDLGTGLHPVMLTPAMPSLRDFGPVLVPPNHLFVMGDNRDESLDSRHFGFVKRSQVLGRAVAVAASVDPEDSFRPRWKRFFTKLR